MGNHKFSRLIPTSQPDISQDDATYTTSYRRGRLFSWFEFGMIIGCTLLIASIATYSVGSITKHPEAVRPEAIVGLCCAGVLLLSVSYFVFRRVWRRIRIQDVEAGTGKKKWTISSPIPISPSKLMAENPFKPRSGYTMVHTERPSQRPDDGSHTWLTNKFLAAPRNRPRRGRDFGLAEGIREGKEDSERLMTSSGSDRSSAELSENRSSLDDITAAQLWRSVFELPGEVGPDRQRRAGSRHDLTTKRSMGQGNWGDSDRHTDTSDGSRAESFSEVTIIITKPSPTATADSGPARDRQRSEDLSGRAPLGWIDPLRSHPIQLRRDASIRQTKSSQSLVSPSKDSMRFPQQPQRPRSAEPRPDWGRRGYELGGNGIQQHTQHGRSDRQSHRTRAEKDAGAGEALALHMPTAHRALRRARSPGLIGTVDGGGLRKAYLVQ